METVLQIAAVCLVGAVLAAVLRQRSHRRFYRQTLRKNQSHLFRCEL